MSITFPCGCVNDFEPFCGVQMSILKCQHHKSMQREVGELGEEYYRENGAMDDDSIARYTREFEECFGRIEQATDSRCFALEIGSGFSPYIPMIKDAGWFYRAIEPSKWAVQAMRNRYTGPRVEFSNCTWEEFETSPVAGLILSAHSLEHMSNAPKSLAKMSDSLVPGGVLFLIVPNDEDAINPDHYWFFSEETLRHSLESVGLIVESMQSRRRISRESFIYCKARKP